MWHSTCPKSRVKDVFQKRKVVFLLEGLDFFIKFSFPELNFLLINCFTRLNTLIVS